MKKTKFAALAAATVMAVTAAGALAGCGGDPAYTISVFLLANNHESKFYNSYFDYMEDELAKEGLNYKIDASYEQEGNYYDKLGAKIARNETPDIFYVRPNEILQYRDNIVSLQSYWENQDEVNQDDIIEEALNMYRYNPTTGVLGNPEDDLYAFPKDLSTQQLGYYKPLLQKFEQEIHNAGYQLPWEGEYATGAKTYTWDEYKEICRIIGNSSNRAATEFACDVPSIEVLTHSFGGSLIDLSEGRANGKVASPAEGALNKAIKYQAELIKCGAANYAGATYSSFTSKRVCFYGLVGSWEVADYNDHFDGDKNWGVMPWPTEKPGDTWAGIITSAGYVVSKDCVNFAENTEKGDIAKRIAASFMTSYAQNKLVKEEQISLPLKKSVESSYRDPDNDEIYSPSTRGFFLDVVTGDHGFFPAKYSTYDSVWLDELDKELTKMWESPDPVAYFNSANWAELGSKMQTKYNDSKAK